MPPSPPPPCFAILPNSVLGTKISFIRDDDPACRLEGFLFSTIPSAAWKETRERLYGLACLDFFSTPPVVSITFCPTAYLFTRHS